MTADIRTAARLVARGHFIEGQTDDAYTVRKEVRAFITGAVWGAARVTPTREQIAAMLRRHNFDELLLGNIEWDGYTAVCACGWSSEEYKMPGDVHGAHEEHAAAHVLALMAELAEGTV